eukprot:g2941.t1
MWRRNRRKVVVVIPAIALVLLCTVSLILAHSLSETSRTKLRRQSRILRNLVSNNNKKKQRQKRKCPAKDCKDEQDREGLLDDEKAVLKKLEITYIHVRKNCQPDSMCRAQKLYLLLGTTKFQHRCVTREKLKNAIGTNWKRSGFGPRYDATGKFRYQMQLIQKAVKKVTGKPLTGNLKALSAMANGMSGKEKDLVKVGKDADLKQRGSDIVRLDELNKEMESMMKDRFPKVQNDLKKRFDEDGEDIEKKTGMTLPTLKKKRSWIVINSVHGSVLKISS